MHYTDKSTLVCTRNPLFSVLLWRYPPAMHPSAVPSHPRSILCERRPRIVQHQGTWLHWKQPPRLSTEQRESRIVNWIAVAFSPLISHSAELSGLHILSWMKGELSLCITMTFRPHSFSHCLTVFGQQMHPHRGVAAPSLHPQSQHAAPHNSPNKRERRVGPSCASCGPWTFEVRWENIPVHLNYIKERAAVEFNAEPSPKQFQTNVHDVYTISLPFCVRYISAAGGVWWSFEINNFSFKYGVAERALPLALNHNVCVYNWVEYDKSSPKKTDIQAHSQLLACPREVCFFRSEQNPSIHTKCNFLTPPTCHLEYYR